MRLATAAVLLTALPLTPQESPTIKVTTRMVQVNVIVRDKRGPVSDLKKEDFSLFEQGKPRTIASFSMTANSTSPAPSGATKIPPNIFSNQMDRAATASNNVTVVLLDGLNTALTDQAYARKAVIQFLDSLHREDRIALYVLGGRLRVLHDFTSDFDQLRAALARAKGENLGHLDASNPELSETGNDAIDDFLNSANQKISDFYTVDRVRRTTEALEAIARHVSSVPGRKNLVWVSSSFPFSIGLDGPMGGTNEQRTFNEEIQRATRRLNAANLAVYPVDARGLVAAPLSMTAAAPGRSIRPGAAPKPSFRPSGLDTMEEMAARTGGKAFYNTNDIRGAIQKAVEDAEVTYTLGFYPSSDDLDGKFHDLKVKVARSGIDVRHRKGYLAVDAPVPNDKQQLDDLKVAAVSPLDLTEIAVSTRLDLINEPKPGTLHITFLIDSHDLQIEKVGDKWTGAAQLMIVQVGAEQKILANYGESFKINLDEDHYKAIMQKGLIIAKRVEPAKDVKQIRVLFQDKTTGKIGSLRMPVSQILAGKPAEKK